MNNPTPQQPSGPQPARAVPAQPAGAQPARAVPAQPAGAQPVRAVPAQPGAQPVRAVPAQPGAQPVRAMPARAQPAGAQPVRATPAQALPAQPGAAHPVTVQPAQAAAAMGRELKKLERLLSSMEGYGASDLHLKTGSPVIMRISGKMTAVSQKPLGSDEIKELLFEICNEEQQKTYDETGDLDFSHMLPNRARFRFNAFRERRQNAIVVRRISTSIPSFQDLNLPGDTFRNVASFEDGLVVLAGVTGSGKSTTIAGMLDYINANFPKHIITIEDPIEYEFISKQSYVSQREIGVDCVDFKAAIRTLVRQDPDVVLIGEMRDQETFDFGLTAAETGHLVFGTLHAGTVAQSIGRILGLFPPERHPSLRQGLEFNLRSIICQKLLKSNDPRFGRIPINEIMISNPAIRKQIKAGEDKKINDVIRLREDGMMLFDQCICDRYNEGLITKEVALEAATNAEQLKMMMKGVSVGGKGGLSG